MPLTALMLEQKKRFSNAGIRAEFVGSTQQDDSAIDDVLHGQVQLLYISPENLMEYSEPCVRAKYAKKT